MRLSRIQLRLIPTGNLIGDNINLNLVNFRRNFFQHQNFNLLGTLDRRLLRLRMRQDTRFIDIHRNRRDFNANIITNNVNGGLTTNTGRYGHNASNAGADRQISFSDEQNGAPETAVLHLGGTVTRPPDLAKLSLWNPTIEGRASKAADTRRNLGYTVEPAKI